MSFKPDNLGDPGRPSLRVELENLRAITGRQESEGRNERTDFRSVVIAALEAYLKTKGKPTRKEGEQ